MTALIAVLGAVFGAGVVIAAAAWSGALPAPAGTPQRALPALPSDRLRRRLALAAAGGLLAAAVTGWPVAAALGAAGGWCAPGVAGRRQRRGAELARIEGIAGWAETLRDLLAAAGGLEQSIRVSAPVAAPAIRADVAALVARLEHQPLPQALRVFADDLDDPVGDLVVAALLLAARSGPARLGDLLGALAAAARAEVSMRQRIEAARARTRSSVRIVTGATIGFSAGLLLLNRAYLSAYDSAAGQAVLAVVAGCYAAAYRWLDRMSTPRRAERFLAEDTP